MQRQSESDDDELFELLMNASYTDQISLKDCNIHVDNSKNQITKTCSESPKTKKLNVGKFSAPINEIEHSEQKKKLRKILLLKEKSMLSNRINDIETELKSLDEVIQSKS
ncbi:hypothetical protein HK096_010305, partial [Nowakowskiella sp. JEL0078]